MTNRILRTTLGVFSAAVLTTQTLQAAEYFVAPSGSDSNPGTEALPFASIARGQTAASAGDTVWLRGGVYQYTSGTTGNANAVLFSKSGTSGNPINYFAYPGEKPVFDFFNYLPTQRIRGFSVQANWLHFKGLELRGVQQTITNVNESWCIRVEGGGGDNNIFERLNLHNNEGPGLFILNGGNNLVLNCDSHDNYDPDRGGENADGFGSHSNDHGNTFIGNRAWNNSDDGFDLINSPGVVTISNSLAWHNGYVLGTSTPAGNGAGIKAGGFLLDSSKFPPPEDVPRHVITRNVSFDNRSQGFYANYHPGGIDFLNNTAFDNGRGFDLINTVDPGNWPADHLLRNNISFSNNANLVNANQALIDDEFNTWNAGFGASAADFISLDTALAAQARLPDGRLPITALLRLVGSSALSNAGVDVGLAFAGTAPDIGALEVGIPLPGDTNLDGMVTISDLGDLASNWQSTSAMWIEGDFNFDGVVSIADLGDLASNWQAGAPAGPAMSFQQALIAVGLGGVLAPEPAAAAVICVFASMATMRRRHATAQRSDA